MKSSQIWVHYKKSSEKSSESKAESWLQRHVQTLRLWQDWQVVGLLRGLTNQYLLHSIFTFGIYAASLWFYRLTFCEFVPTNIQITHSFSWEETLLVITQFDVIYLKNTSWRKGQQWTAFVELLTNVHDLLTTSTGMFAILLWNTMDGQKIQYSELKCGKL